MQEGNDFIIHKHIRAKFKEFYENSINDRCDSETGKIADKETREAIENWWNGEGKTQYFAELRKPAEAGGQITRWAGEAEANALAYSLNINIRLDIGGNEPYSDRGTKGLIEFDVIKNYFELLKEAGFGDRYLDYFKFAANLDKEAKLVWPDELQEIPKPIQELINTQFAINLPKFIIKRQPNHWEYIDTNGKVVKTKSDGNCIFDAIAKGIVELLKNNQWTITDNHPIWNLFPENILKNKRYTGTNTEKLKDLLSTSASQTIQDELVLVLRKLAINTIENKPELNENYFSEIVEAYNSYYLEQKKTDSNAKKSKTNNSDEKNKHFNKNSNTLTQQDNNILNVSHGRVKTENLRIDDRAQSDKILQWQQKIEESSTLEKIIDFVNSANNLTEQERSHYLEALRFANARVQKNQLVNNRNRIKESDITERRITELKDYNIQGGYYQKSDYTLIQEHFFETVAMDADDPEENNGNLDIKLDVLKATDNYSRKIFLTFFIGSLALALVDAAGYGATSMAEAIGVVQEIHDFDPSRLSPTLFSTAFIPLISALGVLSLNIKENKELFMEQEKFSIKKYIMKFSRHFCGYPLITFLLATGSVTEGIIGGSNLLYVLNEMGITNEEHPYILPLVGLLMIPTVSLQFMLLNAKSLKENFSYNGYRIQDGDPIYDYDREFNKPEAFKYETSRFIYRWATKTLVNFLPFASAATMGMLATTEAYALTQLTLRYFDPPDEVDLIAWAPAMVLGAVYFCTHFSLNAIDFKKFLIRTAINLNRPLSENFNSFLNWLPKNLREAYLFIPDTILRQLIAISGWVIATGAVNGSLFTIRYSQPEPVPEDSNYSEFKDKFDNFYPSYRQIFCLALGLCFYLETFAVEGNASHELLEAIHNWFYGVKNRKEKLKDNSKEKLQAIKDHGKSLSTLMGELITLSCTRKSIDDLESGEIINLKNKEHYPLVSFTADVIAIATIGNIKYMYDWYNFPNSVSNKDIGTLQTVFSAVTLTGAATIYSQAEHVLNPKKDLVTVKKTSNLVTITKIAIQALVTFGVTAGTELLVRHVILGSVEENDGSRLDTAQVTSAVAGSFSAVFLNRVPTIRIVRSISNSVFGFFNRERAPVNQAAPPANYGVHLIPNSNPNPK